MKAGVDLLATLETYQYDRGPIAEGTEAMENLHTLIGQVRLILVIEAAECNATAFSSSPAHEFPTQLTRRETSAIKRFRSTASYRRTICWIELKARARASATRVAQRLEQARSCSASTVGRCRATSVPSR
jgi:hypothetical protein